MAEWIEEMEPIAYGALNLKPWEFGRLTVGEFLAMVKGHEWRVEQQRIHAASFVIPAINACSRNLKKPIKAEALLGFDPAKRAKEEKTKKLLEGKTKDDLQADLRDLMHEMG